LNTVTLLKATFWWNTAIGKYVIFHSLSFQKLLQFGLCLKKKKKKSLLQQCQAFNGTPKQYSLEQKVETIGAVQEKTSDKRP